MILPIIMENVFQVSASLVTVAMIGRLSPLDISAQGIVMRITETLNSLFRGVAIGSTVYIAKAYGAKSMDQCFKVLSRRSSPPCRWRFCSARSCLHFLPSFAHPDRQQRAADRRCRLYEIDSNGSAVCCHHGAGDLGISGTQQHQDPDDDCDAGQHQQHRFRIYPHLRRWRHRRLWYLRSGSSSDDGAGNRCNHRSGFAV